MRSFYEKTERLSPRYLREATTKMIGDILAVGKTSSILFNQNNSGYSLQFPASLIR